MQKMILTFAVLFSFSLNMLYGSGKGEDSTTLENTSSETNTAAVYEQWISSNEFEDWKKSVQEYSEKYSKLENLTSIDWENSKLYLNPSSQENNTPKIIPPDMTANNLPYDIFSIGKYIDGQEKNRILNQAYDSLSLDERKRVEFFSSKEKFSQCIVFNPGIIYESHAMQGIVKLFKDPGAYLLLKFYPYQLDEFSIENKVLLNPFGSFAVFRVLDSGKIEYVIFLAPN